MRRIEVNMSITAPTILMCPPDYYGIEYEINPWMSRQRQSDPARARQQWATLMQLLESAGAKIELLSPQPGLPDMVFTANAALIYRSLAVMARFRHPERQGEVTHDEAALRHAGFEIRHVPEDL